jgi:hypothetical protein
VVVVVVVYVTAEMVDIPVVVVMEVIVSKGWRNKEQKADASIVAVAGLLSYVS